MLDLDGALAAAAQQVHQTRCTQCDTPGACWGFDEVDAGIAVAVTDTFLTHLFADLRKSLWAAHKTIKP